MAEAKTLYLYAVRFWDKQDCFAVRRAQLAAHIAWLAERKTQILVAGSLRDPDSPPNDADVQPVGGLWLVEAGSKSAVQALLETDPFWTEGLRERVEILRLSKAFAERAWV